MGRNEKGQRDGQQREICCLSTYLRGLTSLASTNTYHVSIKKRLKNITANQTMLSFLKLVYGGFSVFDPADASKSRPVDISDKISAHALIITSA